MAKPALPPDNLLSALPDELSQRLFAEARVQTVRADQVVFLAGDTGDGCYRIEEGLLKVSVITPGGAERILAILGPGSIVGELSMIDGSARSASVTALRESKLCFVSRSAFEACGRQHPEMHQHLMVLLARRLRDTAQTLSSILTESPVERRFF
jgi:CRP/FNR family transcriptional regulator